MPLSQRLVLIGLTVLIVALLVGGTLADVNEPVLIAATALGCVLTYLILRWRGETPAGKRAIEARTRRTRGATGHR